MIGGMLAPLKGPTVARAKSIPRRKLAAIMMADVVGFSRMTNEDEQATLAALKESLAGVIRPRIKKFSGRLVKSLGDGFLASFDSPVHAVDCALAIQDDVLTRNRDLPPNQRLPFRIGINLGDIVLDGRDVMGDTVNVASRLPEIAEPGGIVVSASIAEHVKGKVASDFADLGARALKNIAEKVRVFRVTAAASQKAMASPSRQPVRPAIAVLPFANMSDDPEQLYFSDGITEDIITELARFRTISVIARTSSFAYRNRALDVKQVATELDVQFLVEGSVRKFDTRARITVQLIIADTGRHIWADRWDCELDAIFRIQDEITRKVVAMVVPKIEAAELETARRNPTGHMRAYDYYLRGKAQYHAAEDAAGRAEARRLFEEAIRIDPEFAAPYAFLVRVDNTQAMFAGAGASIAHLRESAWQNARRAAMLDDSDAMIQLELAWCHLWRGEFDAAERHLKIAMQLNPNDADRAMDCGTTLMYLGEPERAIEIMTAAIRLNPLHPNSYVTDLAEAHFVAKRYDDMLRLSEQVPDRSPQFAAWKAAANAYAGRKKEAQAFARLFVANLSAIWAGRPGAGESDYVDWMLSFCPFRRREDRDHLIEGLRLAGLQVEPARSQVARNS
jgi:TolB-like protein/tetratricopeptide (TPR) repeat protein